MRGKNNTNETRWVRADAEYEEHLLGEAEKLKGYYKVERMYQEQEEGSTRKCLYPLLNLTVVTDLLHGYEGFAVVSSRKNDEEGWWHDCGIPNPLSVEVAEMIGEYVKECQE